MTIDPRATLAALGAAAILALGGCSSDNKVEGPPGGPVTGALDLHCVMNDAQIKQPIGDCVTGDVETDPDAGAEDPSGDYGETLYNAEGDDDDCKYHVAWTATPIHPGENVTFTVVTTRLFDGAPATGAGVRAEVFLNSTHPAASPGKATETAPGTYKLGPIKFDAGGDWTVRFHLYENCNDAPEDSPHGHVAFFVRVIQVD